MIIWWAVCIPVVTALILAIGWARKTVWWELLVPIGVSLALIAGFKWSAETTQTRDTEYWGGWVVQAEYEEPWNKKVDCRHEITCTHKVLRPRINMDGDIKLKWVKQHDHDGYEHPFDVVDYAPQWSMTLSDGRTLPIDAVRFEALATTFDSRVFVELNRPSHTVNGDRWVATWNGGNGTMEPTTTLHTYENRVQAASSLFNFPEVDPKQYGLFDYPEIQGIYKCPSILGNGGSTRDAADALLSRLNGRLGALKQVRLWILVFVDQPKEAGEAQEAYWKGGNKNEFTIAISVNKQGEVLWCRVISWTPMEDLKRDAHDFVMQQGTLDCVKIVEWLQPAIEARFVRKQFKDFSRLTVDPPLWAVILTYVVTLLVNIGLSFWIVQNEHRDPEPRRSSHDRSEQWR